MSVPTALTDDSVASLTSGLATMARGHRHEARAHLEVARCCFEEAISLFERSGSPYEAGICRTDLARVLAALGHRGAAEEEALAAVSPVEPAADPGGCATVPVAAAALSRRQTEVLRLVALGLTNRQIGERLFVSAFTVKRHVADILTRLDLPSRAAAAAWAASRRLVDEPAAAGPGRIAPVRPAHADVRLLPVDPDGSDRTSPGGGEKWSIRAKPGPPGRL